MSVVPQDNSTTVTAFQTGAIDGAWVPEPYATKLKDEGGKVLVDEATLWPGGKFVTTNLVVTTKFLDAHPDIVANLLKGLSSSIDLIKSDPRQAEDLVSKGVKAASGKALDTSLVASSFKSITFTLDPIASSLKKDAAAAKALGFIDSTDLKNIYDLTLLNKLLPEQGKAGDHAVKPRTDESMLLASDSMPPPELEADGASRPCPIADVTKSFGTGSQRVVALEGVTLDVEPRRVRVPARRVGLRQEHAAQPRRRPRPAHVGTRRRAGRAHRLDVPGSRAVPVAHRARQRRDRAEARRDASRRAAPARPGAARDGAPRRLRRSGDRTSSRAACASACARPRSRKTPTCC